MQHIVMDRQQTFNDNNKTKKIKIKEIYLKPPVLFVILNIEANIYVIYIHIYIFLFVCLFFPFWYSLFFLFLFLILSRLYVLFGFYYICGFDLQSIYFGRSLLFVFRLIFIFVKLLNNYFQCIGIDMIQIS